MFELSVYKVKNNAAAWRWRRGAYLCLASLCRHLGGLQAVLALAQLRLNPVHCCTSRRTHLAHFLLCFAPGRLCRLHQWKDVSATSHLFMTVTYTRILGLGVISSNFRTPTRPFTYNQSHTFRHLPYHPMSPRSLFKAKNVHAQTRQQRPSLPQKTCTCTSNATRSSYPAVPQPTWRAQQLSHHIDGVPHPPHSAARERCAPSSPF